MKLQATVRRTWYMFRTLCRGHFYGETAKTYAPLPNTSRAPPSTGHRPASLSRVCREGVAART